MTAAGVTRYTAGPGTGKTYTLLELVRREAEDHGTRIGDLAFMTFARSQAADVRTRIGAVYPGASSKEIAAAVVTVHAAALRACTAGGVIGMDDRIIVEGSKRDAPFFQEFADTQYLPYDPAAALARPDEDARASDKVGNTLFKMARYIQAQYSWTWADAPHVTAATGMYIPSGYGDAADLLQAWAEYKADNHLFEHDDYVRAAIEAEADPPAPIVVADEFQDFAPLQFVLLSQWRTSGAVDRIYVAGDPNQAIYGFRGADPALLEALPGPVEDIGATADGAAPVSRRCPAEIVAAADQVLGGRSNMAPRAGAGVVEVRHPYDGGGFAALVESVQARYGAALVLSRYRRNVRKLSKYLTAAGLPHSSLLSDWSPPWGTVRTAAEEPVSIPRLLEGLDAIAAYERGGGPGILSPDQARALIAAAPRTITPPAEIRAALNRPEALFIPEVLGWFSEASPRPGVTRMIAAGLDFREEVNAGIVAALARGPSRPDPTAIALGTIHSAKGLEAPAVILHSEYNRGRAAEYRQRPDMAAEERRVYYVACTRARDALIILDSLRSGPSAPPLYAIAGVRA